MKSNTSTGLLHHRQSHPAEQLWVFWDPCKPKLETTERRGAWCVLHSNTSSIRVILRTRMDLPVRQNERCNIMYDINITSDLVSLPTTQYLIIINTVNRNKTSYITVSLNPGEVSTACICSYVPFDFATHSPNTFLIRTIYVCLTTTSILCIIPFLYAN